MLPDLFIIMVVAKTRFDIFYRKGFTYDNSKRIPGTYQELGGTL